MRHATTQSGGPPKPVCTIGPAHLDAFIKMLDNCKKMGIEKLQILHSHALFQWGDQKIHIDFTKLLGGGVCMMFYIETESLKALRGIKGGGDIEIVDDPLRRCYRFDNTPLGVPPLDYAITSPPSVGMPIPTSPKWTLPARAIGHVGDLQKLRTRAERTRILVQRDGTLRLGWERNVSLGTSEQEIALSLLSYDFLDVPGRQITDLSVFCSGDAYFLEAQTVLGSHMRITSYEHLTLEHFICFPEKKTDAIQE